MAITPFRLSPAFSGRLEAAHRELSVETISRPKAVAEQVLQLSDFYILNPGRPTPWERDFALPAYLSYFLPLNYVRLTSAFREVTRFLPAGSYEQIWDFGSGLGTTQWVLEDLENVEVKPLFALERSKATVDLHRRLAALAPARVEVHFNEPVRPAPMSLGVFSYSFLEMQNSLPPLDQFAHLLIVEPSTRECGRDLMSWRARLMQRGFSPLAPCTHLEDCPLLVNSQRDWCHQRVPYRGPDWFDRIESHLPMRNRTLTYSYLLMSRTVQDQVWRGGARVIGDTLKENGKTRQMICRGPKREFLSWLHKAGPPPEIPHGALVKGVDQAEPRGGELRPKPDSLEWE
jgi:hypothetical protein